MTQAATQQAAAGRPPAMRIDDLARPEFPQSVQPDLAAMARAARGRRLSPEPLLEAAIARTGLSDYGDPWFTEPLAIFCQALLTEGQLCPRGVTGAWGRIVNLLCNRLLIQDLLNRFPAISHLPVRRPIIIAGMPRSATTHLHNLLAADPALRFLPFWEAAEPVLPESRRAPAGRPDPRIDRSRRALEFIDRAMPHLCKMHEMKAHYPQEDSELTGLSFSFFGSIGCLPSYREWYKSTDQTPAYRYMRKALQVMTWLRGGDRWVLKSPQHLEQFRALLTVFPDATTVVTHRDPVAATASLVTMTAYHARLHQETIDLPQVGAFVARRIADALTACARDRALLPAQRSVDVMFGEFMAGEMEVVQRIYAAAGMNLTDAAHAAMSAHLRSHRRGRHGTLIYDLSPFRVDLDEHRRALAPYIARFNVPLE